MSFDLPTLWYAAITFLFAGYFMLEGFGFGVGILLPFLGRDEAHRTAMIRTIGPVWDGNEVWLIAATGALFAAFPGWYADIFSGFYLPIFLILFGLIVRILGLEWRHRVDTARWRAWCEAGIIIGSWISPVMWGVAVANLLRGVPENAEFVYPLLSPYTLLGAAAFVALFAFHGLTFVRLKTTGTLRDDSHRYPMPLGIAAIVLGGGFLLGTQAAHGKTWTWAPVLVAALTLILAVIAALRHRDGWAFGATAVAIIATTVAAFGAIFPDLWPGVDVWQAASNPYTLKVLTWAAVFVTPFVLVYQGFTYWVFRKRIVADPVELTGDAASAEVTHN